MSSPARASTAVLLIAVILAAGIGIGVAVDRKWLAPCPEARSRRGPSIPPSVRAMRHFRERLELTDEQARKVETILEETGKEAAALRERVEPEMRALTDRSRARIRELLDAKQAAEFDSWNAEVERHAKGRRGHHGPGDGFGPPPPPPGDHRGPGGRRDHAAFLRETDADGDGKLSREECEKSESRFAKFMLRHYEDFDTDGDGFVTLDELKNTRPPKRGERRPPRPPVRDQDAAPQSL